MVRRRGPVGVYILFPQSSYSESSFTGVTFALYRGIAFADTQLGRELGPLFACSHCRQHVGRWIMVLDAKYRYPLLIPQEARVARTVFISLDIRYDIIFLLFANQGFMSTPQSLLSFCQWSWDRFNSRYAPSGA